MAEARPLLAAARVHVRHAVFDLGVDAGLLFPPDDAVLRVDVEGAAARVAVDEVGSPGDLVPRPLLAVQVFPAVVSVVAEDLFLGGAGQAGIDVAEAEARES